MGRHFLAALGNGMGGLYPYVYALAVYNGQLIAGGQFATAGGVGANCVAAWNSGAPGYWQALSSGMSYEVNALTVYHGQLLAGGYFTTAGGVSANSIAAWNGASWQALGSGMDGTIEALTVHNGELIAGGVFTTAGGNVSARWARWAGCPPAGGNFNSDTHVDAKDFAGFLACATARVSSTTRWRCPPAVRRLRTRKTVSPPISIATATWISKTSASFSDATGARPRPTRPVRIDRRLVQTGFHPPHNG